MAKKKQPINGAVVDMSEPDRPVSEGIADAEIAPPVEPTPEPLEAGEIIHDDKSQSVMVDGVTYHHTREALDGRWIYQRLRSA